MVVVAVAIVVVVSVAAIGTTVAIVIAGTMANDGSDDDIEEGTDGAVCIDSALADWPVMMLPPPNGILIGALVVGLKLASTLFSDTLMVVVGVGVGVGIVVSTAAPEMAGGGGDRANGAIVDNDDDDGIDVDEGGSLLSMRLLHIGNWPATPLQIDPRPRIPVAVLTAVAVGVATTVATTLDTVLFTFNSEQSTSFIWDPSNRILSAILAAYQTYIFVYNVVVVVVVMPANAVEVIFSILLLDFDICFPSSIIPPATNYLCNRMESIRFLFRDNTIAVR